MILNLVLYCKDCITVHTIKANKITEKKLRCWRCNSQMHIIDTTEPKHTRTIDFFLKHWSLFYNFPDR